MKKAILLVFLLLVSISVSAQIIFEDDFDGFSQDYVCCNSDVTSCIVPPGYYNFKSNGHDYGECDGQVIPAADRFGGQENNRGFRIYLEEDQTPLRDTQLEVMLGSNYKVVYLRWYLRESFVDFESFEKLFRIADTTIQAHGYQIFIPDWRHHYDPDNINPVYFLLWESAHQTTNDWEEFDLRDMGSDSWHSYELKIDLDNKITEFWVDGISYGEQSNSNWPDEWTIGKISLGGNGFGRPWSAPNEETRDYDDVVFSTEYIGPAECVDGDDISQSGPCYCGGTPSPTDASNVYTSGYCCSGEWQENECSSPPPGIIFEDDFDDWNDVAPADPEVIWDTVVDPYGSEISYSSNGGWDAKTDWSVYGLPDTQVLSSNGRNNSASMAINFESYSQRPEPSGGLNKNFEEGHDELYFRWYIKYDPNWEWITTLPGQEQKLARIKWNPPGMPSSESNHLIIPEWTWSRLVYRIWASPTSDIVYSEPEALWGDYGAGKWISIENYIKLNTLGQSDGIVSTWIDGEKVLHGEDVLLRINDRFINAIALGDNCGLCGTWDYPEEKQMWFDDFVISTEYIGVEPCPAGTEISMEQAGACYCGGDPNPDDASNVYTNGYCCNNSWQSTPCDGPICTEEWDCTDWSECLGGTQIRTCSDPNPSTPDCPTEAKPPESQSCTAPPQAQTYYIFGGVTDDYISGAYTSASDNISRTTNNPSTGTHNLEFPTTGTWLNADILGISIPTSELDWENSYMEFDISTEGAASYAELHLGNENEQYLLKAFTTTGTGYETIRANLTEFAATQNEFGTSIASMFIGSNWPGTIVYLDEIKIVSPGAECRVDADACTISLGAINTCSLDNLQYQYDATGSVSNVISNLSTNTNYNIKIENLTAGTEQNISANTNSAGVLEFSS